MKKLWLISLTALGLTTGSALAADMGLPAYKAPPVPAPSWTGCYVNGGGGGGIWSQDIFAKSITTGQQVSTNETAGGHGWLGVVGGGCDYQLSMGSLGNWVIGAFGDYDFMRMWGNVQAPLGGANARETEHSAWAGGVRLGYLVTPNLQVYTNGGYTETRFGGMNLSLNGAPFTPNVAFTNGQTYKGWFLGGGTEYALNFSWLPIHGLYWRNEYRFSSYQNRDLGVFPAGGGAPIVTWNVTPYVQTITSELVWRFNWF